MHLLLIKFYIIDGFDLQQDKTLNKYFFFNEDKLKKFNHSFI